MFATGRELYVTEESPPLGSKIMLRKKAKEAYRTLYVLFYKKKKKEAKLCLCLIKHEEILRTGVRAQVSDLFIYLFIRTFIHVDAYCYFKEN
jgi:hypothetical protein